MSEEENEASWKVGFKMELNEYINNGHGNTTLVTEREYNEIMDFLLDKEFKWNDCVATFNLERPRVVREKDPSGFKAAQAK